MPTPTDAHNQAHNDPATPKIEHNPPELPSDSESTNNPQNLKSISRRESEGFVAFNKGFDDCEVTPEASNPVKKDTTTKNGKVNLSPMTPLRGIGGQSIQILKIDDLRMFCARNSIKGSRKAKKADICWAVCRAKAMYLAGQPPPYKDLIPTTSTEGGADAEDGGADHLSSAGGPLGAMGDGWGDDVVGSERASKKRRVEDASVSFGELGPLPVPDGKQYGNEIMTLHSRLVKSKEDVNSAIQLREMVESAATLRREIREEKDRRAALWKDFVENVGDESLATTRVKDYKIQAKENGENEGSSTSDEVKGSYETLLENVIEQDELVRQMSAQHAALNKGVDHLIPKESQNDSADLSAVNI